MLNCKSHYYKKLSVLRQTSKGRDCMFAYSDPTGSGALEQAGALPIYRELVDEFYKQFHAVRESGFTLLEAFAEASPANQVQTTFVEWRAFPVTAPATNAGIDNDRL